MEVKNRTESKTPALFSDLPGHGSGTMLMAGLDVGASRGISIDREKTYPHHFRSIVASHAFGPPGLNFGPSGGGIDSKRVGSIC
jgi:hypothetical protein